MGLHPGTPGSCPEPKANAQLLGDPGIPIVQFYLFILFIFLKFLFIYDRHTERVRQRHRQKQGSTHREPDVGFDPGSPGSRPGPKAGAKPLCHLGIPVLYLGRARSLLEKMNKGPRNYSTKFYS